MTHLPRNVIWHRMNANRRTYDRIAARIIGRSGARVKIVAQMPYGSVVRYVRSTSLVSAR